MLAISCSGGDDGNSFSYTDKGNNIKRYKTVKIGEQAWMAENLNYYVAGSKCYGEGVKVYDEENDNNIILSNAEIQSYCDKYGRLYDWKTAMTVCPSGWHLPSNEEWEALYSLAEAKYLKAANGWKDNGNGEDAYGFSALPGGYFVPYQRFYGVGSYGLWWSADEGSSKGAFYLYMDYYNARALLAGNDKSLLLSVRCVMD
jgi:uncharacterized protein (TIGR02145 family)